VSASVLILTLNEEINMGSVSTRSPGDDIVVLDSLSTDRRARSLSNAGADSTRAFDNWSAHQNWAPPVSPMKIAGRPGRIRDFCWHDQALQRRRRLTRWTSAAARLSLSSSGGW